MDDGGAFSAAAPSGLGNFKGVMLCNRPSDDPASKGGAFADGGGPFRSACAPTYGEQIGLNPVKRVDGPEVVKTRGSSAALRRHVKWLRELQSQMRDERTQVEEEEQQEGAKRHRIKAAVEKHRDGVRAMMAERDDAAAPKDSAAKKAKPLWAMTAKEKEDFEDGEAESLINFAEDLDFDKFMGNLEFRQNVDALRDRAGKLQKEQDAFKDALVAEFNEAAADEGSTSAGSPRNLEDGVEVISLGVSEGARSEGSRRSRTERLNSDGRPDWESSTACGDECRTTNQTRDAVDAIMESCPQIRSVHSKDSVARLVEKIKAKQTQEPMDLVEHMIREGPAPIPVITTSADTQARLHKPVDPSNLPFLYRSPAV